MVLLFSSLSAFHCFSHRHCTSGIFNYCFPEEREGLQETLHLCMDVPYSTTLSSLLQLLMPPDVGYCGQCPLTTGRHHCSHGAVGTGCTSAVTGNSHSPGAHTNQKIVWWSSPVCQQDAPAWGGSRKSSMYFPGKMLALSLGISGYRLTEQRVLTPECFSRADCCSVNAGRENGPTMI